ncbi:MAG: hypothetical protein P4M12_12880 [Gammaproteobacteria bacterium]|nr:hypothetical protein [Gammaproteobacteria bacterium]
MRVLVSLFIFVCSFFPVWAYADINSDALLNKVSLRLNAEQWVASKSALVNIGINVSVSDHDLDKVQDQVLQKLTQLSSQGEWHIMSFNRSLDQSGLEKVQMSAQARLPSTALSNLREKTKSTSKPGETYTLDDIQFTPSEDELRAANAVLRTNIYAQAKEEIDRLAKANPDQKYFIHDINFVDMYVPQPIRVGMAMMKMGDNTAAAPVGLAVGDKLILNALVVLASAPDAALLKVANR